MMILVHSTIQPPLFVGIFRLAIPGGSTMVHRSGMPSPPARSEICVAEPTWVRFWGKIPAVFGSFFLDQLQWFPNQRGKKKAGQSQQPQKKRCSIGLNDHDFRRNLPTIFLGETWKSEVNISRYHPTTILEAVFGIFFG